MRMPGVQRKNGMIKVNPATSIRRLYGTIKAPSVNSGAHSDTIVIRTEAKCLMTLINPLNWITEHFGNYCPQEEANISKYVIVFPLITILTNMKRSLRDSNTIYRNENVTPINHGLELVHGTPVIHREREHRLDWVILAVVIPQAGNHLGQVTRRDFGVRSRSRRTEFVGVGWGGERRGGRSKRGREREGGEEEGGGKRRGREREERRREREEGGDNFKSINQSNYDNFNVETLIDAEKILRGNVFIFLGLCLALAGVCGPAWFRTSHPPGPDPTWTLEEAFGWQALDEPHWLEFKVLSVASLLSGFAAMVIAAVTLTKVHNSDMAPKHILLISISILFVPVLKVAHVTTKTSNFGKAADCWSFVLATSGAACMFTSSAAFFLALTKAAFNLCDQKSRRREHHRRRDESLRRNEIIARHFHDTNRAFDSASEENSIVNNELRVSADSDSTYSVISNGGLNNRNTGHASHLPMSNEITIV
ncbi:hypothetical protein MAR_029153 [Mya arenaria]|uniref:Uncharacterized protein n=1 Tax=Mya arenaria TaxID=6604 RepID=A0ABY7DK42_MYAAR|nr:hypothetical protein MAR_029153 [Mya arenaria]